MRPVVEAVIERDARTPLRDAGVSRTAKAIAPLAVPDVRCVGERTRGSRDEMPARLRRREIARSRRRHPARVHEHGRRAAQPGRVVHVRDRVARPNQLGHHRPAQVTDRRGARSSEPASRGASSARTVGPPPAASDERLQPADVAVLVHADSHPCGLPVVQQTSGGDYPGNAKSCKASRSDSQHSAHPQRHHHDDTHQKWHRDCAWPG